MAFYLNDREQIGKVVPEEDLEEFCRQYGDEIILIVFDAGEISRVPSLIATNRVHPGILEEYKISHDVDRVMLLPRDVGLQVINQLARINISCPWAESSFEIPHPQGDPRIVCYLPII